MFLKTTKEHGDNLVCNFFAKYYQYNLFIDQGFKFYHVTKLNLLILELCSNV